MRLASARVRPGGAEGFRPAHVQASVGDRLGYNEKPVQHKATVVVTDAGATVKGYLKHCIILSLSLTADVCRPMLETGWDTTRIPSPAT